MTNHVQLQQAHPVRGRTGRLLKPFPVRNEVDYERAISVLDRLVPLDRPNRIEKDFMDIMLPVVTAYEAIHHAIDVSGVSSLDLLRSLVEDHGMSAADLGTLLGNRSVGSAILRGERGLSKTHIKILADRFKLSPGVFF